MAKDAPVTTSTRSTSTVSTNNMHNITDANFKPLVVECLSRLRSDPTSCNDMAEWDIHQVTVCSLLFWQALEDNPDDFKLMTGAETFNVDLSQWDTSSCTTMRNMFHAASAFNQPIGNWNVEKVVDMAHMFQGASNFNQDISKWNTERVTDMSHMFRYATSFHNDRLDWNTERVKFFSYMFLDAYQFNGQVGHWNTASATDDEEPLSSLGLVAMFDGAKSFNQPLHQWDTSNIRRFGFVFQSAVQFNQDLSSWDVGKGTDFTGMFHKAVSFNQTLCWNMSAIDSSQQEKILETTHDGARIDGSKDCWKSKDSPKRTDAENGAKTNNISKAQLAYSLSLLPVISTIIFFIILWIRRNKAAVTEVGEEEEVFFDRKGLFEEDGHDNVEGDGLFLDDPSPLEKGGEAELNRRIKRRQQIRQKISASIPRPRRRRRRRATKNKHPQHVEPFYYCDRKGEREISFEGGSERPLFGSNNFASNDVEPKEMPLEDAVAAMETMIRLEDANRYDSDDDYYTDSESDENNIELLQLEGEKPIESGVPSRSNPASRHGNEIDVDTFQNERSVDINC